MGNRVILFAIFDKGYFLYGNKYYYIGCVIKPKDNPNYKRRERKNMDLNLIGDKKTIIVKINAELDHHSATEIRKAVDSRLKNSNAVNVIFDFSRVNFMDSSGIGVIMGRYKLCRILGGKVIIFGLKKNVKRIIEMSGIDALIKICQTSEEALKSVI